MSRVLGMFHQSPKIIQFKSLVLSMKYTLSTRLRSVTLPAPNHGLTLEVSCKAKPYKRLRPVSRKYRRRPAHQSKPQSLSMMTRVIKNWLVNIWRVAQLT